MTLAVEVSASAIQEIFNTWDAARMAVDAAAGMTPSPPSYYMIGYSSQNTTQDGKFLLIKVGQIKVVVDRPNLIVRSRQGYY